MENATKALLIAGSVLVAILLIALGLRIFDSTSGVTQSSQATMDVTAITTFNTQFTGYLNKDLTSSQASAMVQKIIASNAVSTHKITFNGDINIPSSADAGKYEATTTNGYITDIHEEN